MKKYNKLVDTIKNIIFKECCYEPNERIDNEEFKSLQEYLQEDLRVFITDHLLKNILTNELKMRVY